MITYELALKLKNAGFPQKTWPYAVKYDSAIYGTGFGAYLKDPNHEIVYIPRISISEAHEWLEVNAVS